MTKRIASLIGLALLAALVMAVPPSSESQTVTPFDPMGSTSTYPFSINPAGAITGFYSDASFANHGFLRDAEGTITTFDAPGAAQGTFPSSINPAGTITGYYTDATFAIHGFLRAVDGSLTTFDVPGSPGIDPVSVNPAGEITGNYLAELGTSGQYVPHGFLRAADGTITAANVDPANSFSINPVAINPDGTIAGYYQDDITGAWHCFLRNKGGVFTTFDIPGARLIFSATLNHGHAVTGAYTDASFVFHSFLRTAHGAITTIDAQGAGTSFFQGTFANSINPAGTITGHYTDTTYVAHGFVWSK